MKIDAFAMERLQSAWENRVAWNLSESGVHPLTVEELADVGEMRAVLLAQPLGYPQTNGTVELRSAIAAMCLERIGTALDAIPVGRTAGRAGA